MLPLKWEEMSRERTTSDALASVMLVYVLGYLVCVLGVGGCDRQEFVRTEVGQVNEYLARSVCL